MLSRDPWVIYPGNLQGRSIRETGPRGAYLVTVLDDEIVPDPEFVPFDTVRWDLLEIDVTGAADVRCRRSECTARDRLAAALAKAWMVVLLAARIRLFGVNLSKRRIFTTARWMCASEFVAKHKPSPVSTQCGSKTSSST